MRTLTRWMAMVWLGLAGLAGNPQTAAAQPAAAAAAAAGTPYVVEYYYKVKWGHFDEFMTLYRRNHYPVLLREQALGRILRMEAVFPRNHAGEASRWDLRFTIVWRDVSVTVDDFDVSGIVKELYPDQAKFNAEEQRRFELLLEHMDVPVVIDDLATWQP
jgi:hypothetical protein